MMWKKRRATKLITGSYGIVRGNEVLTFQKGNKLTPVTLRRPVQSIVPLEVARSESANVRRKFDYVTQINEELEEPIRARRTATVTGELIRKLRN